MRNASPLATVSLLVTLVACGSDTPTTTEPTPPSIPVPFPAPPTGARVDLGAFPVRVAFGDTVRLVPVVRDANNNVVPNATVTVSVVSPFSGVTYVDYPNPADRRLIRGRIIGSGSWLVARSSNPAIETRIPVVVTAPAPSSNAFAIDYQIVDSLPPELEPLLQEAIGRWRLVLAGHTQGQVAQIPVFNAARPQDSDPCRLGRPIGERLVRGLLVQVRYGEDYPRAYGAARICATLGVDGRPVVAVMYITRSQYLRNRTLVQSDDLWQMVMHHEIGHALGIGTSTDRMLVRRDSRAEFSGARAVAAYRAAGAPAGALGIPMTADSSHWEDRMLRGELMIAGFPSRPLSAMSVAALADLGFIVTPEFADPFVLSPVPAAYAGAALSSPADWVEGPVGRAAYYLGADGRMHDHPRVRGLTAASE